MDCTGSMGSWIERSKTTLKGLMEGVKNEHKGVSVFVSFIGFRDV